jgi:peptidoglycan hydrolase CwlO-like protein
MFKWLILKRLKRFQAAVDGLTNRIVEAQIAMSAELDRLKTSVQNLTTVTQSVVTLVGTMAQQIRDLKNDPAALTAYADEVDTRVQELKDATLANTPSAGEPPAPTV